MTYHVKASYPVLLSRKPTENTHFGSGCFLVLCAWRGEFVIWTEDEDNVLHSGAYFGELESAYNEFKRLT